MPRIARTLQPGAVYHVTCRFIDQRFELDDELRAIVLDRSARVFRRSDWILLTYALMTSHLHWAVLAGQRPSSEWTRALNTAVASAIQASRRRKGNALGAVFAARPTELIVDSAVRLFAYIHNNPVNAELATSAEQSTWTGHRAMIGLEDARGGADVRRAIELAGFEWGPTGHQSFHQYVVSNVADTSMAPPDAAAVRVAARAEAQLPLELGGPRFAAGQVQYDLIAHPEMRRWVPIPVDPRTLVDIVARRLRAPLELVCSRNRSWPAVGARRLALLTGRLAGLRLSSVAAALGMSLSAANDLISKIDTGHSLHAEARAVIEELRSSDAPIPEIPKSVP